MSAKHPDMSLGNSEQLRVLAPTAILGYGFPESSLLAGMALNPHVVAVDAGSSDPGPYYLGAGKSFTDRLAVKRDLKLIMSHSVARGIPCIVGSAGGAGAKPHVDWLQSIVSEIAEELRLSFRLAVINSDIPRTVVLDAYDRGSLAPLGPWRSLTRRDIEASTQCVAQMGVEPIIECLARGADVIVAGRAYDPAVFAALPISLGYDKGLALHMGKILECAAIACSPGSGSDCLFGTIERDRFTLRSLSPHRRCTVESVAAHSLYEKSDPYRLAGPGGVLDLRATTFEQVDDGLIAVRGSRFVASPYCVKVEAARLVGYRTICIAGCRDDILAASVEEVIGEIRAQIAVFDFGSIKYDLAFRLYGKNGVMGRDEPEPARPAKELCIIIEAVADSQSGAKAVCSMARSLLLHYGYKGRISTAGNLAFPYSPSDIDTGEVYQFALYHLLPVSDPCSLFPIEMKDIDMGQATRGHA